MKSSFVRNIPNKMYPKLLKSRGYKTTLGGVCHGVSVMYGQAIKAHEEKHHDERQAFIRDLLQQEAEGRKSIEEQIQAAREKMKERKKERKKEDTDDLLLELPAYFDGVALAQAPSSHPDVFNKKLTQESFEDYIPFITPSKIEAEQKDLVSDQSLVLMYDVCIFNRQQLAEYFRELREILRNAQEKHGEFVDDLPFIVGSFGGHHAMAYHYNYHEDNWTFRDPNKIKLKIHTNDMASIVMRSIFEPNQVGLDIFLDVTPKQKSQLPHLSQALAKFQEKHASKLEDMAKLQTDGSFTLLNYAFQHKNEKTLQLLRALNKEKPLKARGINVNFRDKKTGFTAAHHVITHNDIELFKILVELGIDVTTPDNGSRTPLQHLIYNEADELANAFCTEEAKLWSKEKGMYIDANKGTALHYAILRERPQVVEHILTLLEKQGAGDEWIIKQCNIKNIRDKTAIDCAFYGNNEEIAIALTKRLLRCANRENKVELFQKAMQQGFIKVCDMIVASLKDESKIDEKILFLQLATGSTHDDLDPIDSIIELNKQINKLNAGRSDKHYEYYYKDNLPPYGHDYHQWDKKLEVRNDLFIAEIIKRHSICFQKQENREKFNTFISESHITQPAVYREFLRQCESDTERDKYLHSEMKYGHDNIANRAMYWAILNKQEEVAIDLIKLGVDPSASWNHTSFLERAIQNNLTKLTTVILDNKLKHLDPGNHGAIKMNAKKYLHPYSYDASRESTTLFQIAIGNGDAEQVKMLYKFMEGTFSLNEMQACFVYACKNSNIQMVNAALELFCPNKKDINKVTATYFADLRSQLGSIEWSEKSEAEKSKLFHTLLKLVKEYHPTLSLSDKVAIFKLGRRLEPESTKAFILPSFRPSSEFREFIVSGRLFEDTSETSLLIKFLNAFREDKAALKVLLYKDEYSLLEKAIRDNQYAKATLFLDFLLDSLTEVEKKAVFSWAIKYKMGSIANTILASIPTDREEIFLGALTEDYKKLCPSNDMIRLREESNFQQNLTRYFKEEKHAEMLQHFRTSVLLGDTDKINKFLISIPSEELKFFLNHRDLDGRNVLSDALLNGDENIALSLLRAGAKNIMDFHFVTAFTEAVWIGAYEVVEEMLSADKDLVTVANMTNALSQKQDDVGLLFVTHGCGNYYVDRKSSNGYRQYKITLLHVAIENDMEKTALALASKADFYWNIPDTDILNRMTPTHTAAIEGNPTILRKAIEAHANFFIEDANKRTPADILVSLKRYGILVELLEATNEKVTIAALRPSDLDKIKEEFIQQIERQALENPDVALARLTQVCERKNLLAQILLAKDSSPGAELFNRSRSDSILSEFEQMKARVEKMAPKPESGFGIL